MDIKKSLARSAQIMKKHPRAELTAGETATIYNMARDQENPHKISTLLLIDAAYRCGLVRGYNIKKSEKRN